MENIRKDTKDMNDKEKILYVYNYVASHNYDKAFTSLGSNQSAYSFFTKGTSVCAGFAKASQIIFQNIGINSYLVINDSHLWNYVEYEGKWYVFDATVGSSYTDKTNPVYYDGLGRTTVDQVYGFYKELYPKIEETTLKELFNV
jgi:transglutaminase/protease-like cytokinesis protein 3